MSHSNCLTKIITRMLKEGVPTCFHATWYRWCRNMYVECQQWHFEFYALLPYEIFTFFLLFESQVLYFSFILRLMMILSLVIFQLPPQIDDTWRWRREQANLADFCTFWNFHTIMWRERGIWMVCVYVVHGKKRAREGCNFSPTHHFSSGKL